MVRRHGLELILVGALTATSASGEEARLLAPGRISTAEHNEFGLALSPDGGTAYFTRGDDIYISSRVDGQWTPAARAPFCSDSFDGDPFVTADGTRLFFMSERRGSEAEPGASGSRGELQADVWVTDRRPDGSWGPPVNVGRPINTPSIEGHASAASNGNLYYFSGHERGLGGHDIYRSVAAPGGYVASENLGRPVNSEHGDGHPYISPDEDYLLFYSHRPGGYGSCDLYISFRDGERWSEPRNLGADVNTADCEMTPHVSPDGASLYFARIHEDGGRDLYVIAFSADRWRAVAVAAERFEEGTVSTGNEFALALTPDGASAYLTRRTIAGDRPTFNIVRTDRVDGRWSKPVAVAFNSEQRDADPFISPDGLRQLTHRPRSMAQP